MKKYQRLILCLFLAVLVTACATRENKSVPQAFFCNPNSVVITQLTGLENPDFYKDGPQGVADFVVTDLMTEDLQEKIKEIKAESILSEYYFKRYGTLLAAKFLKVKEAKNPINKKSLQDSPIDDMNYAPHDFRFLKNTYGVDYALILDPRAFGIRRSYYGFIPTSDPKGYANLSIYLVNLSDNSIVSEYKASIEEKVMGEWDEPPAYSELVNAAKSSLAKALSDAYIFFFR